MNFIDVLEFLFFFLCAGSIKSINSSRFFGRSLCYGFPAEPHPNGALLSRVQAAGKKQYKVPVMFLEPSGDDERFVTWSWRDRCMWTVAELLW